MGTCARALALMTFASTTSCVVPIPASPEERDGGVNGFPVIVSASPATMKFPGPIKLDPTLPQQITVTLKDGDLDDTLVLRVFRNYPSSLAPLQETTGIDAEDGERLATLDTAAWCFGVVEGQQLTFTLVVADRPFAANNIEPPFQAVTAGGQTSSQYWIATCVTPPQ
jgi:hypothetical protein